MHLGNHGGFIKHEAYRALVQLVLDLLEVGINVRYHLVMIPSELKLVVQDRIAGEMAEFRRFR
ncbi:MAG: hypothetical protein WCF90_03060 [Methanomicrobiales archaeon]